MLEQSRENQNNMNDTKTADIAAKAIIDEAQAVAKNLVDTAARTAARMTENTDDRTTKMLADALREVFGENTSSNRFIDITRIPLICQSINGIHENLTELKQMMKDTDTNHVQQEEFKPVKLIAYGLVSIILLTVVGALLSLIIVRQ
jgi:hypothetical protein